MRIFAKRTNCVCKKRTVYTVLLLLFPPPPRPPYFKYNDFNFSKRAPPELDPVRQYKSIPAHKTTTRNSNEICFFYKKKNIYGTRFAWRVNR